MDPVNIPVEIDTPHQVLLWSVDEFVPFMVFMIAGNMLGQFFLGLGIGWAMSHLYRRYKNTRPDGYLLHLFYWAGLAACVGRTFVNPFKRQFTP